MMSDATERCDAAQSAHSRTGCFRALVGKVNIWSLFSRAGWAGTLTTFQVEPDCITLLRMGEFNSQMVFQSGRRHFSMYDTPYGALSISVNTRKMRAALDDHGGQIEIDYAIEIDHAVAGENAFHIDVREKEAILKQ